MYAIFSKDYVGIAFIVPFCSFFDGYRPVIFIRPSIVVILLSDLFRQSSKKGHSSSPSILIQTVKNRPQKAVLDR